MRRVYEIKSTEYDEIIGRAPTWIVKYGIATIFFLFLIIFLALFFIQYPDKITARATLISDPPPLSVMAKKNGTITFFVPDNAVVSRGDIIGQVDHQLSIGDYRALQNMLSWYDSAKAGIDGVDVLFRGMPQAKFYGPLQGSYMQFLTSLNDLKLYYSYRNNIINTSMTQAQLQSFSELSEEIAEEIELYKENMKLARKRFQIDSALGVERVIAQLQTDNSRLSLLDRQITMQKAIENMISVKSQEQQLTYQLQLMGAEDIKTLRMLELALSTSARMLKSEIQRWAEENLLLAPVDGKVSYTSRWSNDQPVTGGSEVLKVSPAGTSRVEVRAILPMERSGKVEVGQEVHIKMDNYPYEEYGILYGKVKVISAVPGEGGEYVVNISLDRYLTSSSKKEITFKNEMQASVEIVTKKRSVINRLISKIVKTVS